MTVGTLNTPTVETERLILRGWREEDVEPLKEICCDEDASRFIGGVIEDWQVFRSVCQFIGHWQLRGFSLFCVEEKESRECIGWAGPWRPEGWPDNEIGYAIRPSFWGKGYASEAASAALRYAYEHLGWETAISCIDEGNTGSEGVAKRLGASLERRDVAVNAFVANIWRHLPPAQFLERAA